MLPVFAYEGAPEYMCSLRPGVTWYRDDTWGPYLAYDFYA